MSGQERQIRREYFWRGLLRAYADLFITWEEVNDAMRKADLEQNWGDNPPELKEMLAEKDTGE